MRIFAGPNGSGKSTLYKHISEKYHNIKLGKFVNADEINKFILENKYLDFSYYGINNCSYADFMKHYEQSTFTKDDLSFTVVDNKLECDSQSNYFSAFVADYCRIKMLEQLRFNFSCETVFSHESKLALIHEAKNKGFEVYLYFVCMPSPDVCMARVGQRVELEGHDVPKDKIEKRYYRTLENLYEAAKISDRVFFLSNDNELILFAEKKRDGRLTYNKDTVPAWFVDYVIKKMI